MTTSTKPATLTTTDQGVTLRPYQIGVDTYIWHRGAFRRITAITHNTARMGRYSVRFTFASTFEGAPAGAV